jgi:hypothetical protein
LPELFPYFLTERRIIMPVMFEDGTYEIIKNIPDVERVLTERLGKEPAEAIMEVFNRQIREKDFEIESLQRDDDY